MEPTVRLKVVFDHIVSKFLNSQDLKRCWVLLKPHHKTISDLSSYLLTSFSLQNCCPYGLRIKMEGFDLPGFESTSIFRDKDLIRVERNGGVSSGAMMLGDKVNDALEIVEVVETQPAVTTGMNLLANEEFEKETGVNLSEDEEENVQPQKHAPETVSKKRKANRELKSPKKKKRKSARAETCAAAAEGEVEGKTVCCEQNGTLSTPKQVDDRIGNSEALPKAKRSSQSQGDGDVSVDAPPSTSGTKKVRSRSAERKKAKRRWLREKNKAEKNQMEDFPSPGSKSFRDKDIISVEKNGGSSSEIMMVGDEVNDALEGVEIVETQPVDTTGMKFLANKEFEKETGGYSSEEEEDASEQEVEAMNVEDLRTVYKKRKAAEELKTPKEKKNETAGAERCATLVEEKGKQICSEDNAAWSSPKVNERIDNNALWNAKRFSEPQQNVDASPDTSPSTSGTKKLPSRSSRRKKAQRTKKKERLRAEQKKLQRKISRGNSTQQSSKKHHQSFSQTVAEKGNQCALALPATDYIKLNEDDQQPDTDSDSEGDVVPIVIRPGHIRFGPLKGSADQAAQQPQIPLETFQWNGTTNKKKGQKWGKEKSTSYKWNDYNNTNQECSTSKMQHVGARSASDRIDFEKLEFYTTLPKEGDVIAYRLIELSSSWTPELSSYKVGKVSRYDMQSNRVRLLPVPGYPLVSEAGNETYADQPGTTYFGKDGSIWIDFSSLIEVRLVTQANPNSYASGVDEVSAGVEDKGKGIQADNGNDTGSSAQENVKANPWEEISQALNAKKAELAPDDNWNNPESSGKKTWTFRAMRGSALGPTMALLRSQNQL